MWDVLPLKDIWYVSFVGIGYLISTIVIWFCWNGERGDNGGRGKSLIISSEYAYFIPDIIIILVE